MRAVSLSSSASDDDFFGGGAGPGGAVGGGTVGRFCGFRGRHPSLMTRVSFNGGGGFRLPIYRVMTIRRWLGSTGTTAILNVRPAVGFEQRTALHALAMTVCSPGGNEAKSTP